MKRFFLILYCTTTFSILFSQNEKVEISETEDPKYSLESIEVTAFRFELDTLSVPINCQIIDRSTIENSASTTIPEVLRKEGNIRFMSFTGNDAEGNLSMRGFGENSQTRVLVIVDGIKYNPSDMSSINWTQIPLSNVDHIEILRGSQSAMYGSNAEAGVIKITTNATKKGCGSFVSGMYGSYGLYSVSASGYGNERDFFYGANISSYNSDGYRDFSSAWANSAGGTSKYNISEQSSLTIKGDYTESFVEYPNPLDWETFQNNPRKATDSTPYKNKAGIYSINLMSESSDIKSDATFGISFRDRIIDTYTKNNQWTFIFSPRFEANPFDDLKIFTGIDTDYSNIDYGKDRLLSHKQVNTAYAEVNRIDAGYYLSGQYNVNESLILSAGGRADAAYTSVDSTELRWITINIPPSIRSHYNDCDWLIGMGGHFGATYKINKESSLYSRFDQIYHYPTTDEIASYQGYGTNVFTFNKDLKPEHGQNYEIGYKYLDENWTLNFNGFITYLENEIQWDDVKKMNVNLSPTIRYGLDSSISYDSKYYGASISGTLVNAEFAGGIFKGNSIPLVAPFNGMATLYIKPIECVKMLSRITYYTCQTMGNDNKNIDRKIPAYYTIDFQINVDPCKYVTIFGAIENVTNENYAAFAYNGGFYPNAGRTFKIGINIKL